MPDDEYRVFDKPKENRMMITPSIGSAMTGGLVSGLTLGTAEPGSPKPFFQSAAQSYLKSTGRDCTITDGYVVAKPQWEFTYKCKE